MDIPSSYRIPNPHNIPVHNQGNRNNCTSHAVALMLEYQLSNYFNELTLVDVDDFMEPPFVEPKYVVLEGYLAYFEWTGERTYRYKVYPVEGEPEYEYKYLDRESRSGCGLGGCPKENINWDNISWKEGSI